MLFDASCSPGTRVWQSQHHLENDWRQPRLQNGTFPVWDIPCAPHTVPARENPLSQIPWELPAWLPVDNVPASHWIFSLQS